MTGYEKKEREFQSAQALSALLRTSLESSSLENQLGKFLDHILAIPWLPVRPMGAILLVDEKDDRSLYMAASRHLSGEILRICAKVAFGFCLCGRVAETKNAIFTRHLDSYHEVCYEGIEDHGHYVFPIVDDQNLFGVLSLSLDPGYQGTEEDVTFLEAACHTMAGLIRRRQAEEALWQLNDVLEQRVKERTAELESSMSALKKTQARLIQTERLVALGGLVAGISHEVSTPLGIGVTAITHLRSKTHELHQLYREGKLRRTALEEYLREFEDSSSLVYHNLERAANLIKSFKEVAIDQTRLAQRKFNLCAYLDEVFLSLRPKLKNSRHTVEIDCPDDLVLVSYPGILSQIITNLVINSLMHGFLPDQSGHIHLSFSRGADQMVEGIYRDDGQGMDEETLRRIFEPFYTTARNRGGSGLGMHIVYNLIAQELGGTLHCESEPGKGIAFFFRFPLSVEEGGSHEI